MRWLDTGMTTIQVLYWLGLIHTRPHSEIGTSFVWAEGCLSPARLVIGSDIKAKIPLTNQICSPRF